MLLKKKGLYITVEGISGCGKSTQIKKIVKILQNKNPDREIVLTREPGGTDIAEEIRKVVQVTKFKENMDPVCEAYLYASSRAQSLRTVVKPALEKECIVFADRSYITSMAFQGFGRGLGIDKILKINQEAIKDLEPDLIIIMDIDPNKVMSRMLDQEGDKFETEKVEFFEKVREGYIEIAKLLPNAVLINADGSIEEVTSRILEVLKRENIV